MTRDRAGVPLWAVMLVLLVVAILQRGAVVAHVDGDSMSPAAPDGSTVLLRRDGPVTRGDLVVVEPPPQWRGSGRIVKRVVAVGGDRVSCCDRATGAVVVNGEAVAESYLAGGHAGSFAFDATIPDGALWLLGDNRAVSIDSRAHVNAPGGGAVDGAFVVGVVWWVIR